MKGLQFTTEEKQLLIEALLFTSCSEVCSDHTDVHRLKMISLAEKINDVPNKLYNIYTYKTNVDDDKFTDLAIEKFTNLPIHDIITD
jgi:hypothetical protein